jgi:L-alanine-DL-glutamate epimerase-like enolase superfamily enzyme
MTAFRIANVRALVYRVPITTPIRTSFGTMHDRPAVLIRIEDDEGAVGWGEVWCNFPAVGAEHRARLVDSVIAPLLVGQSVEHPSPVHEQLTQRTHILGVQSGEPGPLAQVIAGVDVALWDLSARRAGQPLWKLLGGSPTVSVYASGLNPEHPEQLALRKRSEGFRAFKLKVGFGRSLDSANMAALREALGPETRLMIDANQAWSPAEAVEAASELAAFSPFWLEEPIAADAPLPAWQALAAKVPIPLAGGENIRGRDTFAQLIGGGAFAVVQPDIGKWGGFSGCLEVGRMALAAGLTFCPHWLGGGIGLVASMHLLAAVGGDGLVEVDANDNPLRELLAGPHPVVRDGAVELSDRAGLGVAPDLEAAKAFLVTV